MRALGWDLVAVVLLSIYGTEVCPFIEGLGLPEVSWRIGAAFALAHAVGHVLDARLVETAPPHARTLRTYALVLMRYVVVGVAMTAYDSAVLHFPLQSGVKLVVGTLALGHFVAVDLALARERDVMAELERAGAKAVEVLRPRSFARRLATFAVITVALVVFVVVLVVRHDLGSIAGTTEAAIHGVRQAVMVDIGFVGAILVVLVLNLIVGFTRNLARLFGAETRVLNAVGKGDLDARVPVMSDDEFGVIAAQTNKMIEGLCERRKMKDALGKIVSPDVARMLLDGEGGLALGGTRRTLTLLFSDIRGFTTWSEGTEPELLVRDLNRYFTEMVAIVHEEGGIVDKFIGDGMMAVFGLTRAEGASSAAARAALRMEQAVTKMAGEFARPLEIGVGVHRGEVVAGNIGSPDRMEFTFIGDAVNTAARLESLTRKLDAVVLVSRAVVDDLPEAERAAWESRGAHELKGKTAAVEAFAPRA